MLNKLMSLINGLEERDLNNGITENDINDLGFILIRNTDILNYYGMAIAGAFMANKEIVGKDNVPMIIVDETFYELSDNCKAFIIGHELGHFMNNHEQQTESNGISVAGCTIVKIGFRPVPYIMTDAIFDRMTEETQRFIINHELGHFHCHKNKLLGIEESDGRTDIMEFEADEYSANIVGIENAIKALEEIKETLDILGFGKVKECTTEFDRRIENLNKLLVNI